MFSKQLSLVLFIVCLVILNACSSGSDGDDPPADDEQGQTLPDDPGLPNLFPPPSDSGSVILLNSTTAASVTQGGQVNYAFTAQAGIQYTVTVKNTIGVAYLRVFLNDEQMASSLTQFENSVTFTPQSTATYIFSVRGHEDSQFTIHVGEGLGQASLWLASDTIELYATRNGSIPLAKLLDVYHGDGDISFASYTTLPSWLDLSVQATERTMYSELVVSPNTTDFGGTADVLVRLSRNGNIIAEKALNVDYKLLASLVVQSDQRREITEARFTGFELSATEIIARYTVNRATTIETYQALNNALHWTAQSNQAWLDVRAICSCLNGGRGDEIYLTIASYEGLGAGSHSAQISLSDLLTGEQKIFTVWLTLNENKLIASKNGIALMKSDSESVLTKTVHISNNANMEVVWSAGSNAAWLQAEPDFENETLILTADPQGLAADTTHFAEVNLSSPQTRGVETIYVGFYVRGAVTTDTNIVAFASKNYFCRCQRMAADPVRPLVYIHSFGGSIQAYNIYTSEPVNTYDISGAVGRSFVAGDIEISSDGKILYIREDGSANVVAIDLDSGTVSPPLNLNPMQGQHNTGQMKYTRIDGKAVLITYLVNTSGTWTSAGIAAYDASNGTHLTTYTSNALNDAFKILKAPPVTNYLAVGDYNQYINSVVVLRMRYSEADDELTIERYNSHSAFPGAYDHFTLLNSKPELFVINNVLTRYSGFGFAESLYNLDQGVSTNNMAADYLSKIYALLTWQADGMSHYSLLQYDTVQMQSVQSIAVQNAYKARETQSRLSGDGKRFLSLGFTGGSPTSSDGEEVIWMMATP